MSLLRIGVGVKSHLIRQLAVNKLSLVCSSIALRSEALIALLWAVVRLIVQLFSVLVLPLLHRRLSNLLLNLFEVVDIILLLENMSVVGNEILLVFCGFELFLLELTRPLDVGEFALEPSLRLVVGGILVLHTL